MKKIAFIFSGFCLLTFAGYAQDSNSKPKTAGLNKNETFEEFRKRVHGNYNQFRQTILEHYADFLNGEWHEYESLNGLKRDETPKPEEAPHIDIPYVQELPSKPTPEPEPEVIPEVKPQNEPVAEVTPEPELEPQPAPEPQPEVIPEVKPQTEPVAEVTPESEPEPAVPLIPSIGDNNFKFTFYEVPTDIEDFEFTISDNLINPSDFANQWQDLEEAKVGEKMLPGIQKKIKEIGLNDYLAYRYIESYVNAKFPEASNSSKMALVHYLLVHLGYDARIAVTTKGTPLLLIPFKQMVYGKSYLALQNQKYYIFPPEGKDVSSVFSEKVMTCQLPSDIDKGNTFDLVVGELKIPVKPKKFDLEYGPLHLTGELNEYLIPILYHYPQMPIEDYAKSNIQPKLRNKLIEQVKQQLGGMEGDDGVEALLHFTQNAFQYATDDNYHGFEKPYFVEETLFYPKNDCEDRAIFYTYFLYNALGRDAQLVSFPGHEAATVTLNNPQGGVSYQYNGKTYYISDPTYIGASTGMIMPSYFNMTPEIDYTYSKN